MAGFGFGFSSTQRKASGGGTSGIAAIRPGTGWNGTAGSGFTSLPVDPARTTAKPALRLLVPPRQRFTQTLTVGVLAMANDRGTLFSNLGLSQVRVHYEGAVHQIAAPSLHSFTDVNGVQRAYMGWWVTLEHSGVHGEARIYFEAIPRDTAMQPRVIGPFSFFPAAQQYDYQVEVRPSQPVITNQRYPNIRDAANALRTLNSQHGRIVIAEPGTYDFLPLAANYAGAGYCTIEASVPVTIAKAGYVAGSTSGVTNGLLRPKFDGLWFKGSNITIDMANVIQIYHEVATNPQHVFEGVTITDSNGRGTLWLKGQNPVFAATRDNPYYLECNVAVVQNAFANASLVRGCNYGNGAQDAFSYARCIAFNTVSGHHNRDWRNPLDAIALRYSGPAVTATIELSGGNDTNARVLTAKQDGATVASFTLRQTDADFIAGTNYHVANVATWLNSLTGWSATLLDDTRRATALSHSSAATLGGAFGPIDAKSGDVKLHTVFDVHGDAWAFNSTVTENLICFGNLMFANDLPLVTFGLSGAKDVFFVNNAGQTSETLNPTYAFQISQWNKPYQHAVIAHNSLANQKLLLRTASGMTADAYSLVANNAMLAIDWDGTPTAALKISANHVHAGQTAAAGSTGTTSGGNQFSLFVDAANGNFAPAVELLTNLKRPVVKHDRTGRARSSTRAPAGSEA